MKFNTQNKPQLGRLLERTEANKRQMIVEAWKKTGYLNGLKGKDIGNFAVLAENQKGQLLKENTTSADMNIFDTIAIPMIRRQNNLMISPSLISVQPLSYPHGVAFYLDYKVSSSQKPLRAKHFENDLSGGQTDDFTGNTFESRSGYDRHYNNDGYDNSKGRAILRGWNKNAGSFDNTSLGGQNDTTYATALGIDAVPVTDANGTSLSQVVDFDLTSIGGLSMDNAASLRLYEATGTYIQDRDFYVKRVIQNYTNDIFSTGRGANTGTTSTLATAGGPGTSNKVVRLQIIWAADTIGPNATANFRLGFKEYLNLELNAAFSSELKLDIQRIEIKSQIHKMKVAWTLELAEDLMAYHALDAEVELVQMLAEEVAAEKDRMIIRELLTLAAHAEVWNADFYKAVDPNPNNTVFRGTEAGYNQGLVYAINRMNSRIQKATKRGGANWVLISAEGAAKLQNLDVFKSTTIDDLGTKFAAGVERIGTLENRYQVYVDPNLPAFACLVGRKGTSFFDTGYVYCPYIEYMLSPTVLEDQDFSPRKMISSRFATKMLNNKFYGVVVMKNIEEFTTQQEDTTF